LSVFDGATSNWDGADNVGMVHITTDDPVVNTGASLLQVTQSGQAIASAEGFLARFIASGTARTDATAVEIEVAATQPALAINGITTITGQDNPGASLVRIIGNDAAGNGDTLDINTEGTGDGIEVTCDDADSVAIRAIAAASQTTSLVVLDAATSNWDGADNIGLLHLNTDDPYIHAGASALQIVDSSTPISAAEGFLARFVHSGTARTNSSAVEIEVPATQPAFATNGIVAITGQDAAGAALVQVSNTGTTGDADAMTISSNGAGDGLQITAGDADSVAQRNIAAASQTTSLVVIDGATNNWDGADNIGALHLTQDDAVVHTGATQLMVENSGTTVASAEGFLARFLQHTGAAVTTAYAVEIETTNTTPALMLNNQMTISAADSAGTLFDITAIDTTGNSDTMTIAHSGTGDGLQITCSEADSVAANLVAATSQTTSVITVDGTTGSWIGAATTGMIHATTDGALVADGSLVRLSSTGNISAANDGALLELVETGNAQATSYLMRIASTNNEALHVDTGAVLVDETVTATLGLQVGVGETLTANNAEGAAQQVDDIITVANVTANANDADDFITLPNDPPMGTVVKVLCNSGSNFEVRTLQAGNDTINGVDTSDGGTEYLATNGDLIIFTYHIADGWQGTSFPAAGGVRAAVTPD
jgi:hypothetical protein